MFIKNGSKSSHQLKREPNQEKDENHCLKAKTQENWKGVRGVRRIENDPIIKKKNIDTKIQKTKLKKIRQNYKKI